MKLIKKFNKKQKILFAILIAMLLIILILILYKVCTKYIFKDEENELNVVETIKKEEINLENYDYYIRKNATEYEKTLFEELKQVLSVDEVVEEEYAKVLTKLFLSDLFTLNNKTSSSDISSSQYVYNDYEKTFEIKVKNTIYENIELNLAGDREQSLPIVKNVEVSSVERNNFSVNNQVIDSQAFYINASIQYEQDLGYPITYRIVIVKNNDLLQVVKADEV